MIIKRPFLATRKVLINVQQEKLNLRIHDKEIIYDVFDIMKYSLDDEREDLSVDVMDDIVNDILIFLGEESMKAMPNLGDSYKEQLFKGENFLTLDASFSLKVKSLIEKPLTPKLKSLPSQL